MFDEIHGFCLKCNPGTDFLKNIELWYPMDRGYNISMFFKNLFQDFTLDKIHGFHQTYNTKIIDLSDFFNSLIFKKQT